MNNKTETAHKRLVDTKAKLLALDYAEPVGLESLDLVQRLLEDLIATTESYEFLVQKEEKAGHDLALAQSQIFPLKKEVARLTKENNQLHMQIIHIQEQAEEKTHTITLEKKLCEEKNEDLEFLCSQKDVKLKEQAAQLEELQASLARALEGETVLPEKSPLAFGHAKSLSMNKNVPAQASVGVTESGGIQVPGAKQAAVGPSQGSQQIEVLRQQLESLGRRAEDLEAGKNQLEQAVASREREISRLGKLLESTTEVDLSRLSAKYAQGANNTLLNQLKYQVDFLNDQLARREEQIMKMEEDAKSFKNAGSQVKILQDKVDQLQQEKMGLQSDVRVAEEALKRMELQSWHEKSPPEIHTVKREPKPQVVSEDKKILLEKIQLLEEENVKLHTKAAKDSVESKAIEDAQSVLEDKILKYEEERKVSKLEVDRLTAKLHDAEIAAQSFQLENSRVLFSRAALEREAEGLKEQLSAFKEQASNSRLNLEDSRNQARVELKGISLEADRLGDQLQDAKKEVETLKHENTRLVQMLAGITEAHAEEGSRADQLDGIAKFSSDKMTALEIEMQKFKQLYEAEHQRCLELEQEEIRLKSKLDSEHTASQTLQQRLNGLQELATTREEEVATLRKDLIALESLRPLETTTLSLNKEIQHSTETQMQLKKERDGLLSEKEKLVFLGERLEREIQVKIGTIKQMTAAQERLTDQMRERDQFCEDVLQKLKRVEEERDALSRLQLKDSENIQDLANSGAVAVTELEAKRSEIDQLMAEILALRRKSLDSEARTREAESEMSHLAAELAAARERERGQGREVTRLNSTIASLQSQLLSSEAEANSTQNEATKYRELQMRFKREAEETRHQLLSAEEEAMQMKALASQLEAARDQFGRKLNESYNKLKESANEVAEERRRSEDLTRGLEAKNREVIELRQALESLDAERDSLQHQLDAHQETHLKLQSQKADELRRASEIQAAVQVETGRADALGKALSAREHEVQKLQSQITTITKEYAHLENTMEVKMSELRATAEDLQLMTRENQAISSDIAKVTAERDSAKQQVQGLLHRCAMSEQVAKAANIERDDIMTTYKALCEERKHIEAGADDLSESRNRLSLALQESQREAATLQASLRAAEAQLRQRSNDSVSFEHQVEALSREQMAVQRKLDAAVADNRKLVQELWARRQAASQTADRTKALQLAASKSSGEATALRSRMLALERERDALTRVVTEERHHGTQLQQVLEGSRAKEAALSREIEALTSEKATLETQVMQLRDEIKNLTPLIRAVTHAGNAGGVYQHPWPSVHFTSESSGSKHDSIRDNQRVVSSNLTPDDPSLLYNSQGQDANNTASSSELHIYRKEKKDEMPRLNAKGLVYDSVNESLDDNKDHTTNSPQLKAKKKKEAYSTHHKASPPHEEGPSVWDASELTKVITEESNKAKMSFT